LGALSNVWSGQKHLSFPCCSHAGRVGKPPETLLKRGRPELSMNMCPALTHRGRSGTRKGDNGLGNRRGFVGNNVSPAAVL